MDKQNRRPPLHFLKEFVVKKLILFLCAVACWSGCQKPEMIQFYVAAHGNDENPGTLSQPFATLERSRDAIRSLAGNHAGVQVLVRGGVYVLQQPLVFEPQDSAPEGCTVVYKAFQDEKPLISGGRLITGWQKQEKNRWTATLDKVSGEGWWFRDLYKDGLRLPRGRFPQQGMLTIRGASPDAKQIFFAEKLPALPLQDLELVILQNWSISRALIAAVDAQGVLTRTPCGWVGHEWTTAQPGKRAYLENALAFVDEPGEWHLDRHSGLLTYQAAENENPNDHSFIAPCCEQLLILQGRRGKPVRGILFQGLDFAHAGWSLPEIGYAGIQACFYGPGYTTDPTYGLPPAIQWSYAEQCGFDRCRLQHTGASGMGLAAGCRDNRIEGCTFADIGGNGVMCGWRAEADRPPRNWFDNDWADSSDAPRNNRISNCLVTRCGAQLFGAVGIFDAFSRNTAILHNWVYDLPYTGISIGFRWDTTATSQCSCRVENNHIHDVMKLLADGGGIYTLGWQPGTVLKGNLIHDVHRSAFTHGGAPNNGIFFDEGSKGFHIEKNVIYATSGEPIRFNQNKKEWHSWKDNVFGRSPDDPDFPKEAAAEAGLQPAYANIAE